MGHEPRLSDSRPGSRGGQADGIPANGVRGEKAIFPVRNKRAVTEAQWTDKASRFLKRAGVDYEELAIRLTKS